MMKLVESSVSREGQYASNVPREVVARVSINSFIQSEESPEIIGVVMHVLSQDHAARVPWKLVAKGHLEGVSILCGNNNQIVLEFMMCLVDILIKRKVAALAVQNSVTPVEEEVFTHNTYHNLFEHGPRVWDSFNSSVFPRI